MMPTASHTALGTSAVPKKLPRHLAQLEDELCALGPDAMLVEELDGFVAALLVCPELIKPGEWLPVVCDAGDEESSPFEDLAHANRVFALIMEHYNSVAATLFERPETYRPLLPSIDENDVVWEVWIDGFAAAVEIWPDAWDSLRDADETTAAAFEGLMGLVDISASGSELTPAELQVLSATVSDKIAGWIIALNKWRLANDRAPREIAWGPPPATRKVGRNEPCPCGSGKKYKRCCGAN
ncbi:YgfB and YecA [Rhodopseudomonas palustris BisB5]|uniref:YgfB and YecA n=1 Tax=Rhodopseudomonas palustris (strain BisB5) TaxID=316057 RepID=Q138N0_RHOPS|nr:YgfB and YecA [Rhodopseudomonas palustris BisB5]